MTTYRTFTPDLEVRAAEQGGDGRTIVGIAVPYGRAQRIHEGLTEQFARGAFNAQLRAANRVPFARDHLGLGGTLIGRTVMLRDDEAGLYGEWRVSKTAAGDETLELVRDGALSHLSIGFRERKDKRLADGTIERTRAELREVAAVLEGAYGEAAAVSGMRADEDADDEDEHGEQCRRGNDHETHVAVAYVCGCGAQARLMPRVDESQRLGESRRVLAGVPLLRSV